MHAGKPVFGVVEQDEIALTSLGWADVLAGRQPDRVATVPLAGARLLSPVERPGKIVAIGQNYWDHCR
ncbi:MAG TPA: DUF2437 domain-containing protein, partial [Phycisphaerae bacterium]|nr:DUF2437 domain-containing protein [Phycisphaerae bacterium]